MKKFMKTQVGRFTAGLLALLIVIGAAVGAQYIPFLTADVTAQKLMSMSGTGLEIAEGVDAEVTISYIATETGRDLWVEELAKKYAAANSRISYEMVSPGSAAASRLAAKAGKAVSDKMLIITSGDRAAGFTAEDLYQTVYNQMYLQYYGQYVMDAQYFIADQQLANAILYVTRDDLPVIYALNGHGEKTVGAYALDQLFMSNIVLKTLNLTDAVPEDAAAVMIYAPTADLSKEEAQALRVYLGNGGDLILASGYMMEEMPNLESVLAYYGMEPEYGVVLDTAAGYCYDPSYPQYLMPDAADHPLTAVLAGAGVKPVMSLSAAMKRSMISRAGLTVTGLLTTSEQAYMKTSLAATSLEMEEGDPTGRFTVAMAAEEGETHVVWFGSGSFLNDADISVSGGYNIYLLGNTLSMITPITERVNIEGGDLMAGSLKVPDGQATVVIILMFVPALLALLAGVIVKNSKKKK